MAPESLPLRGRRKDELKNIVAIDFGTTYSGVAYANTHEPHKQTLLTNWGRGTPRSDKVPTVLRYDNDGTTGPFKWGHHALRNRDPGEKIHEWFKLGLCPDYAERREEESELAKKYPSTTGLPPVNVEDAEKLTVDYLSSLNECVDEQLKSLDPIIARLPREYIVTVPAIWDHKEQDRSRRCAEKAGLGEGSRLRIISEPEAAAIYALDRMSTIGLKVGDTFVICDAGGGTVDLASYTIRSLDPITLAGAAKGSGGLYGSTFLNRIFAKRLERKVQGYAGDWDFGMKAYAVEEFENHIKPVFEGDDAEPFSITFHGIQNPGTRGTSMRTLKFTGKELRKEVFHEVIDKIEKLVAAQITNTSKPAKALLLAGGFGQSSYLKERLKHLQIVKSRGIQVQQIENSATAIVRGALIAGLTRQIVHQEGVLRVPGPRVESRVAGKSYGTRAFQPFNQHEDEPWRNQRQPDGEYRVERMQWFITEGDQVTDNDPKTFTFYKDKEVAAGPIQEIRVQIYSCERQDTGGIAKPKYPGTGVRKCAELLMDLRDINIPKETHKGTELYVAKIDIEMILDSASLSFCGVYAKGTSKEKRFKPNHVQFS